MPPASARTSPDGPARLRGVRWADAILLLAAAVGLFVSMWNWFDRHSGIQGEPGTMLVIVACGLILFGLAVTVSTASRGVYRLFQWLILLGTVLTAIAAWFLMSWILMWAMVVATVAQIVRMTAANRFGR